MFSIWNWIFYTTGWTVCLLLASIEMPELAFLGAFAPYLLQIGIFFYAQFSLRWVDSFLGIYAFLLGFGFETLIATSGVVHYVASAPDAFFPPLWILAIYLLFSSTLNHSFLLINTYRVLPLFCGLAAPFSYLAGSRLAVCAFPLGFFIAYITLAFLWVLLLYILVGINRSLKKTKALIEQEFHDQPAATMLYDGACPLCSREVQVLQASNPKSNIHYVDVTQREFESAKYQNLTYQEAMKHLYVVNERGEVLKGVEAFFCLYAKVGWTGLAMALKAPAFQSIFKGLYSLFARYRLFLTGRKKIFKLSAK